MSYSFRYIHNADRYLHGATPVRIPAPTVPSPAASTVASTGMPPPPLSPITPPPEPSPANTGVPTSAPTLPKDAIRKIVREVKCGLKRGTTFVEGTTDSSILNDRSLTGSSLSNALSTRAEQRNKKEFLVLVGSKWVDATEKQAGAEDVKKQKVESDSRVPRIHWMEARKTADIDDFDYRWSSEHRQCYRIHKGAPAHAIEWSDGLIERPADAIDTDAVQAKFEQPPACIQAVSEYTWGDVAAGQVKTYAKRSGVKRKKGAPKKVDPQNLIRVGTKGELEISIKRKEDYRKGKDQSSWAVVDSTKTLFQITDRQCCKDADKCKAFVTYLAKLYIDSPGMDNTDTQEFGIWKG